MAEQLHDAWKGYTGHEHLGRICVPELMRHNACVDCNRRRNPAKVRAELANHCFTRAWTADEEVIRRASGTQCAKAIDQVADERVDGHHAFGLEFAQRDKNGGLAGPETAQAIERQIEAFAEAHPGVPLQQQKVARQIVAAPEFVLDEFVLFGSQCARKLHSLRGISSSLTR